MRHITKEAIVKELMDLGWFDWMAQSIASGAEKQALEQGITLEELWTGSKGSFSWSRDVR